MDLRKLIQLSIPNSDICYSIFFLHRYAFLFYINPQFYGYAAIAKALLNDVQLKCAYDSTLNCINTNGNAVLASFGYDTVNIYENLAVS